MEKTLRKAWQKRTPVTIIYKNDQDVFTKRTILITKIENEYIHAYCYLRQQFRTFSMHNIFSALPAAIYYGQHLSYL